MKGSIRKNKRDIATLRMAITNGNVVPIVKRYFKGSYVALMNRLDWMVRRGYLREREHLYFPTERTQRLLQKIKPPHKRT